MYKENEMEKQNLQFNSTTTVQVRIALPSYHFKALLKEKYDTIKEKERTKGSVSVFSLWEEMEKEEVSRIQFEDDLLDLEKKQVILLQRANLKEEEREKVFIHPTRGVLKKITWKNR